MITITGGEHEYRVSWNDMVVANVWHSDLSEWTVETPDGPVYRERTVADTDARVETLIDSLRRSS